MILCLGMGFDKDIEAMGRRICVHLYVYLSILHAEFCSCIQRVYLFSKDQDERR